MRDGDVRMRVKREEERVEDGKMSTKSNQEAAKNSPKQSLITTALPCSNPPSRPLLAMSGRNMSGDGISTRETTFKKSTKTAADGAMRRQQNGGDEGKHL